MASYPIWSAILNRKDSAAQSFWTEWRITATSVGGSAAQAGDIVLLNADGQIDSSLLPVIQSIAIEIGGTPVPDQSVLNFIAESNIAITADSNGGIHISATGETSTAFNNISTGINTTSALGVGTGASVYYTGSGIVNANEIGSINITGNQPTHAGQLLISQPGNSTAVWADPQVQGLYAAGSSIASPPAYAPPTTIQPVLVGAADQSGNLQPLNVLSNGALDVSVSNFPVTQPVSGSVSITNFPVTQPISGSVSVTNLSPIITVFNSTQFTSTAKTTIWTPTSGKKFRLSKFIITATEDRQIAGSFGEDLTIQLFDGASLIPMTFDTYVMATGATGAGLMDFWNTGWIDLGSGYVSSTIGNALSVSLTIALVQGFFRINVIGDEE